MYFNFRKLTIPFSSQKRTLQQNPSADEELLDSLLRIAWCIQRHEKIESHRTLLLRFALFWWFFVSNPKDASRKVFWITIAPDWKFSEHSLRHLISEIIASQKVAYAVPSEAFTQDDLSMATAALAGKLWDSMDRKQEALAHILHHKTNHLLAAPVQTEFVIRPRDQAAAILYSANTVFQISGAVLPCSRSRERSNWRL
jgi:hypothetical protein